MITTFDPSPFGPLALPLLGASFLFISTAATAQEAAAGPFQATMESLEQYQYPDWFRDAKFGIWSHWGPQAVPMIGDWYARRMYEEGSRCYKHHVQHYGHPSEFGYKDIIPLWKAEKWDPERLMRLYKNAGAKYFVSMGVHHDNFFLWNSKLHPWNSVNMGPKRDVVGEWQRAARNQGLRFGVSEHLGASFWWFQTSHGADKSGPMAGVPYDGADPKWRDLYHSPAEPGDREWYSANPKWQQQWTAAIKELVDTYQPDLLYSDGPVVFHNEVGLGMIAHLYNSKPDAVYNCKQKSDGRWVEDLERGIMPKIDPYPWQTDTSIGDWYYNRDWKFRPVSWVIHMLVDNVSKNGNLLLNVVQRPDGSLDPEVEQMLEQLAVWNAVHGEAIYGTRPWLVYGESAVKVKGGKFAEDFTYNAKEIRFTTKGTDLYAIALGWPEDNTLVVRSLAESAGKITAVSLLGHAGTLAWQQTAEGLVVTLPNMKVSEFTCALKISGTGLKPVPLPTPMVRADAQGNFRLAASDAQLHGEQIAIETKEGQENLGYWDNPADSATWNIRFDKPGTYTVTLNAATTNEGATAVIDSGGRTLAVKLPNTGDWTRFQDVPAGKLVIAQAGVQTLKLRAADPASWKAINLRSIQLTPAN